MGSAGNSALWWQAPIRGLGNTSQLLTPFVLPATSAATPVTATASSPASVGPFTAEVLTKNPELAAILKKLYPEIGNLSTDPNVNQTVLQRNVKLPEVEKAGQAALATQQADASNNAQTIADFAKDFMASQPAAQARADQEAGNIGKIQSGELAAMLAENQRATDISSTQNLMRRLGVLAGTQNLGDLSRGGVTNSNANANILRAAAEASLARDAAALAGGRQNIMDVQNLQVSTAGLPQRILDAVLQRRLAPVQASQTSSAADVNRLQAISGLLAGNNLITPQTQAGLIGQIQQLLQGQAGIDPAAYYRYVRGDFPNQMPGVVPQQGMSLPNPYANQAGDGGSQMMQQILAAIQGNAMGGGGQPYIGEPGDMTPVTRAPQGYNLNPFKYPTPTPEQIQRDLLRNSFTNPTGGNAGYADSDVMAWLSQLSPEQLAGVPMGGYE